MSHTDAMYIAQAIIAAFTLWRHVQGAKPTQRYAIEPAPDPDRERAEKEYEGWMKGDKLC